jgi:negative regulator of sigma F NrsF-like protein
MKARPDSPVPEHLYAGIRAALAREPPADIRAPRRRLAVLGASALLIAALVLGASMAVYQRPAVGLTFGVRSAPALFAVLCALLGITCVSTAVALHRGRSGLGASLASLAAIAVLVAPLYAALSLANPVHIAGMQPAWVDISPWGARCFFIACGVGTLVLASSAIVLRRAVPVASGWRAAAIGAAAGSWAGLAVFVFCPSGDRQHLLVGHVFPVMALVAAGALTLARRLRP